MRQIAGLGLIAGSTAHDRVWLRTLILIRWLAICGQLAAITIAWHWFGFVLPLGLCFLALGASIIVNLVVTFIFPGNRRLSETGALCSLLLQADKARARGSAARLIRFKAVPPVGRRMRQ